MDLIFQALIMGIVQGLTEFLPVSSSGHLIVVPFFLDVGSRFFTDGTWSPLFADPEFGVWQLLNGTFLITGIAILVAIQWLGRRATKG